MRTSEATTLIVGYGTLLYRASLGGTIGGDSAEERPMRPVVVSGYRRLFNLRPEHYESSTVLSDAGNESAAMNVETAPGSSLNGLAFEVTPDELILLDRRERYYARSEATLYDFDTGERIGTGAIYAAAPGARWLESDTELLLPQWRDIEWGRAGAYAVSREFGEFFDRTTFLADAETLVVDRYRGLLTDPSPLF